MISMLLNLVFWAANTLLNLIAWFVFAAAAHLVVAAIRAFKLPGQAIQGALEQLGSAIRACLQCLLELVAKAVSASVSSLFDALKEGASGSAAATGSALGGLVENLRAAIDDQIKDIAPQVMEGFTELINNAAVNLWNNYKDAVGYVLENM